jgi:hypothetical protein
VNSVDYLSMCLESKDSEKAVSASHTGQAIDRSCWCLFRMSVHGAGGDVGKTTHTHRDSYGRFAADAKHGDNTSLGWNDYMRMADFVSDTAGYVCRHQLPGARPSLWHAVMYTSSLEGGLKRHECDWNGWLRQARLPHSLLQEQTPTCGAPPL